MYKLFLILSFFLVVGCNANETFIEEINPNLEKISFDVVEKKLILEEELPEHMQVLLTKWFNEKIKVDGFDGDMIFKISNYNETVELIDEGKKVDITLSFSVILTKSASSSKKFIDGSVSSFGTIKGNFSINDFEKVIKNTQSSLIQRLTRDLKSKTTD